MRLAPKSPAIVHLFAADATSIANAARIEKPLFLAGVSILVTQMEGHIMTWKRALSYIAVAIASCILTVLVIQIVIAGLAGYYLAEQTEEFRDLVGAEVLKAKDPPPPRVRKPGSVEASTKTVIDVSSLTDEQRARLDKFMQELIAEQIAE